LLWSVACGRQDGVVGVQPLGAAGAGGTGGDGAAGAILPTFLEEFAENANVWAPRTVLPGASTGFGQKDAAARDGNLAELRFPGNPSSASADNAGPGNLTELATKKRFGFGTFRTRLGFGSCKTSEDVVMSFLGYFKDHLDHDGDGIVDDLEITFQVLCGAPTRAYLTVFTDDDEPADPTVFRKLTRLVDLTNGDLFDTLAPDIETYAAAGRDAQLMAPGVFTPDTFYELGFEWHAESLRFFLLIDGNERNLWTLDGAERVPQLPVSVIYNMWHPDAHWYPRTSAANFPANDVVMQVDWMSFEPE
jgi:hypothetical protein